MLLSAMTMPPVDVTATPNGLLRLANVARPPSPPKSWAPLPAMVEIVPGSHVGVGDGVMDSVGVFDPVVVGVTLPPLCGQPPAGSGVCAGLELAGALGSNTPKRRPLAMTLAAAVAVTLAYKKQLATGDQRSSVKAKTYPSQPGAPQQAMRQAPSEGTARGASVRGAPTRSVWGRAWKREEGQARPGVRVEVSLEEEVDVWLEVLDEVGVEVSLEDEVDVWLEVIDVIWLEEEELDAVWLEEGVTLGVGIVSVAGRHGKAILDRAMAGTEVWPKVFQPQHKAPPASDRVQV